MRMRNAVAGVLLMLTLGGCGGGTEETLEQQNERLRVELSAAERRETYYLGGIAGGGLLLLFIGCAMGARARRDAG